MATIEVSEELKARIRALAAESGESEATILRLALENGMEGAEDYLRAHAIAERIRNGEGKTVPLEQARRRFGLAD